MTATERAQELKSFFMENQALALLLSQWTIVADVLVPCIIWSSVAMILIYFDQSDPDPVFNMAGIWYGSKMLASCRKIDILALLFHCHSLRWRHNECDGISNHQPHDCLPKLLFRHRSKKTSYVTGLCIGNSLVTGEFPTHNASNAEKVSIWWRHHVDKL